MLFKTVMTSALKTLVIAIKLVLRFANEKSISMLNNMSRVFFSLAKNFASHIHLDRKTKEEVKMVWLRGSEWTS